jgi:hypothetical protein
MESVLSIDIPVQMISCTDTDGRITPLRFRFRDRDGELITVRVDHVVSTERNEVGVTCTCSATFYGEEKQFVLWYSFLARRWRLSRLKI